MVTDLERTVMLVMERKAGERIMLGDDIVITIVEVRPNGKVKVGVDAPKDLSVLREELLPKSSTTGGE